MTTSQGFLLHAIQRRIIPAFGPAAFHSPCGTRTQSYRDLRESRVGPFLVSNPDAARTLEAGGGPPFVTRQGPAEIETAISPAQRVRCPQSRCCLYKFYTTLIRAILLPVVATLSWDARSQTSPGSALNFNGVSGYVTITNAANFNFTGAFTVEAWIKVAALNITWQAIVTKGDSAWRLQRYANSHVVSFSTTGLSDLDLAGVTPVDDGNWHHVAGVYDGSGHKYLYVDGALDASATDVSGALGQDSYPVDIGENAQITGRIWDGEIDEVRVWNMPRSQAQIQAYMNTTLTLPQTNLVAYWRFDEGGGDYAYDSSGQGQTGDLINGPAWVQSTLPFVPGVVTLPASQGGADSATLNALVNPNGLGTMVWFQWGLTTNYGNTTITNIFGAGTNSVPVAIQVSGLLAGETINFAVVATNSTGLAVGNNQVSTAGIGIPTLTISLVGTNAIVSWPAGATSYSLQTSTNLANPLAWLDEDTVPQLVGSQNVLALAVNSTNTFFRLAQASMPVSGFNAVPLDDLGTEVVGNQADGVGGNDGSASPGIGPTGDESSGSSTAQGEDTGGGSVFLNDGELIQRANDLSIPGRGLAWSMDRTYRSGLNFDGPLGHNWEFSYNRRLALQTNGDILRMDGYGRSDPLRSRH